MTTIRETSDYETVRRANHDSFATVSDFRAGRVTVIGVPTKSRRSDGPWNSFARSSGRVTAPDGAEGGLTRRLYTVVTVPTRLPRPPVGTYPVALPFARPNFEVD